MNKQIKNHLVNQSEICVVGLGFVGLTLGLVLSEAGFKVLGIDKFKTVIDNINNKKTHFYEKGLVELLESELKNGFSCSHEIDKAGDCNVYIIAVGTPVKEDNQPNFQDLENATKDIGKILKKDDLVILRSTVPIGVTRNFVIPILEKESGLNISKDFFVAFAPERTVEGEAINELKVLPQIIGGYNKLSADKAAVIFDSLDRKSVV